ncbi:polysaccharide biosynthesis/export family protein [Cloacibacterium sp. TD35]|uniref:polysaccharide biosynthesis/export family protein n=1 Tax=Cloacibacterium sp. TD35 TaxID=2976818 RepID=UPI00237D69A8|nr:polysaccharide biosynthesis/export family protein [Cloacibacterium sp. TD35]WDT68109.1 polysaccharide biosynthesis/export family protein [Cloacibacterium sp. TD35]
MKKNVFIAICSIVFIFLNSCTSKKKLDYLQNIESVALEASVKNAKSTIQPNDQLVIMVTAKDMDVVKPFNQNFSSGQILQYSLPSNNSPAQSQTSTSGPTYIVDSQGDIEFPVIGKINTENKSTEELRDILKKEISKYVVNPQVSVKNTNYKITVLGEVNKPGTYNIPEAQTTVLEVLGLAGDLTIYGNREDVLVLRNIDGTMSKERINLTQADFINSPYFYLKQNDVIIVSPNETKQKTSRLDPNAGIYISVASIVVTILALIFKN